MNFEKAERIAEAIIRDLFERKGYDAVWDSTDPEIQEEIRMTLIGIVLQESLR